MIRAVSFTPDPPLLAGAETPATRSCSPVLYGMSVVGGCGLGPEVQLSTVLLQSAPYSEAADGNDDENKQLLHDWNPSLRL
ncbi:hypothetical protein GCM10009780_45790 [Actinomadura alba]